MRESTERSFGEILTAVLITGVNTPDHDVMFSSLNSTLKTKVTPLIAHLKSKDCSRVSTLISNIVHQLTDISTSADEEYDTEINEEDYHENGDKRDAEFSPIKLKLTVKRRRAITLTTLVNWYNKNYGSKTSGHLSPVKKAKIVSSPRKKIGKATEAEMDAVKTNPPIVIMLEDAENINPDVLQDFISICSSSLSSVPVVLVLGIATAMTVIHQLLPPSVSSLLCIEKFQAPSASCYLTQLMDKVIMTPDVPFKLGPRVFHFLLDIFLYHDFSVLNFIVGFEYSMAEHFLSNPLSLLCCSQGEVGHVTSSLTHAQLEDIRRQPAFMRYVFVFF